MSATRGVAALSLVTVILAGPLAPWGEAQQATQAPEISAPREEIRIVRRTDAYDVAAGVATVARAPLNAATCIVGGAFGTALFILTFGSAYKATARVFEEGCAQRWVVRGDDLRPRGPRHVVVDQPVEMYGPDRR